MTRCYFYESLDTKYCNLCEKYFCSEHRKRYDKRIKAMVTDKLWTKGIEWVAKE